VNKRLVAAPDPFHTCSQVRVFCGARFVAWPARSNSASSSAASGLGLAAFVDHNCPEPRHDVHSTRSSTAGSKCSSSAVDAIHGLLLSIFVFGIYTYGSSFLQRSLGSASPAPRHLRPYAVGCIHHHLTCLWSRRHCIPCEAFLGFAMLRSTASSRFALFSVIQAGSSSKSTPSIIHDPASLHTANVCSAVDRSSVLRLQPRPCGPSRDPSASPRVLRKRSCSPRGDLEPSSRQPIHQIQIPFRRSRHHSPPPTGNTSFP